jgi:flagellar motor switch protein FliN/FliY
MWRATSQTQCLGRERTTGGRQRVSQVNSVQVEISVVLGRSTLPMQQLLRMGRGAVIPLDANEHEPVWILANNHPVARGEIQISDDKIAISVIGPADVYDYMAGGAGA